MEGQPMLSPGFTTLDRILDLVTQHDANYRNQELRMTELIKRMASLEEHSASELDVKAELEAARAAVERLHVNLVNVTRQQEADKETICDLSEKLRLQGSLLDELRQHAGQAKLMRLEVDELTRSQSRLSSEVTSLQEGLTEAKDNAMHLTEGMQEAMACLSDLRSLQKTGKEELRTMAKQESRAVCTSLQSEVTELKAKQQSIQRAQEHAAHEAASQAAEVSTSVELQEDNRQALQELSQIIKATREEHEKTKRRVARCQSDLTELRHRSDGQGELLDLKENVSSLTSSVTMLQERHNVRTGSTEDAMQSLGRRVNEVEALAGKLAQVEVVCQRINEVDSLSRRVGKVESLSTKVMEFERDVKALEYSHQEALAALPETPEQVFEVQEGLQVHGEELASLADCVAGVLRTHAICCSGVLEVARAAAASSSPNSLYPPPAYPTPHPGGCWACTPLQTLAWRSLYPVKGSGVVATSAALSEHQEQMISGLTDLQEIAARLRTRARLGAGGLRSSQGRSTGRQEAVF